MFILTVSSLENRHLTSKLVGVFSTLEKALTHFNKEYSIFEDQLFIPNTYEVQLDSPIDTKSTLIKDWDNATKLFEHEKE